MPFLHQFFVLFVFLLEYVLYPPFFTSADLEMNHTDIQMLLLEIAYSS